MNELWEACSNNDFETFRELLKNEKTDVNSTNSKKHRLFNLICDSVCRGKLSPDFFYEMLKRKDLDINFQDEHNPAPMMILCFDQMLLDQYSALGKTDVERNADYQKYFATRHIKTDLVKALLKREDLNTKQVYIHKENDSFTEYLSPIAISINYSSRYTLKPLLESKRFDINSTACRSGIFLNNGKTQPVKLYDDEVHQTSPYNHLELSCANDDVECISEILNSGAKITKRAISNLQKTRSKDEEFYHNSEKLYKDMQKDMK